MVYHIFLSIINFIILSAIIKQDSWFCGNVLFSNAGYRRFDPLSGQSFAAFKHAAFMRENNVPSRLICLPVYNTTLHYGLT